MTFFCGVGAPLAGLMALYKSAARGFSGDRPGSDPAGIGALYKDGVTPRVRGCGVTLFRGDSSLKRCECG